MLSELLMLNKGVEMKIDNLKPVVHLLLNFIIPNVAPRLGDQMTVRKWELLMLNQKRKRLIPHVRLLSALLKKQGAILPGEYAFNKPHIMFSIADVCRSGWLKYVKTKFWHKVKIGDDTKVNVL
ncbi:hypothetical protein Hanom_Chr17g01575791 [Helianthus anomalus]